LGLGWLEIGIPRPRHVQRDTTSQGPSAFQRHGNDMYRRTSAQVVQSGALFDREEINSTLLTDCLAIAQNVQGI
jgi:hypothetical protein